MISVFTNLVMFSVFGFLIAKILGSVGFGDFGVLEFELFEDTKNWGWVWSGKIFSKVGRTSELMNW